MRTAPDAGVRSTPRPRYHEYHAKHVVFKLCVELPAAGTAKRQHAGNEAGWAVGGDRAYLLLEPRRRAGHGPGGDRDPAGPGSELSHFRHQQSAGMISMGRQRRLKLSPQHPVAAPSRIGRMSDRLAKIEEGDPGRGGTARRRHRATNAPARSSAASDQTARRRGDQRPGSASGQPPLLAVPPVTRGGCDRPRRQTSRRDKDHRFTDQTDDREREQHKGDAPDDQGKDKAARRWHGKENTPPALARTRFTSPVSPL